MSGKCNCGDYGNINPNWIHTSDCPKYTPFVNKDMTRAQMMSESQSHADEMEALGEQRPEVEDTDIEIAELDRSARRSFLDARSLFFRDIIDNIKLMSPPRTKPIDNIKLMSPPRTKPDAVFHWEYQGYDPYNHHGRFMHNIYAPMITTKIMIVIDEASNWPLGDPRNHVGARL